MRGYAHWGQDGIQHIDVAKGRVLVSASVFRAPFGLRVSFGEQEELPFISGRKGCRIVYGAPMHVD